ncbi:MAG TPA: DUF6515 family protein [Steroidobacteraceae bacterium]|nr:DUF6515 family protein [Steroidobacteraceae bacterium]
MNARILGIALVVACALGALPAIVRAAPHDAPRAGYALDNRYQHNRYYPARGATFHAVPWGGTRVYYRGAPYFFHEGAWYRPWGRRFVVVAPPIGIGISVLPPYCTTLWFGGVRYYYADDTYYVWRPELQQYVVTAPPPEAAQSAPPAAAATANTDVYVYPNRGQNADLQASDRYECHAWAVKQSGFDPTQPLGGVAAADAGSKRADYQRAEAACLEGRGYTVR